MKLTLLFVICFLSLNCYSKKENSQSEELKKTSDSLPVFVATKIVADSTSLPVSVATQIAKDSLPPIPSRDIFFFYPVKMEKGKIKANEHGWSKKIRLTDSMGKQLSFVLYAWKESEVGLLDNYSGGVYTFKQAEEIERKLTFPKKYVCFVLSNNIYNISELNTVDEDFIWSYEENW